MDNYTRYATCSQLSHLTDLNTFGIIAMREGKNIDAILLFREAIKLVQSTLFSIADGTISIIGTGMLIDHLSLDQKVVVSGDDDKGIRIIKSRPTDDDNNDYSMYDDVFMLYKRALDLAPGITNAITQELSLYHIVSSVLLYNYGLVNHLEGLRTCDSWLLSQALDHYSRAYHIMKALSDHRFPENISSSLSLGLLAIANNVGHIHAYNCRHTKVWICCDEIMRLLSTMRPPVSADGYTLDEEYETIFLNVYFFLEANLAGAPAA